MIPFFHFFPFLAPHPAFHLGIPHPSLPVLLACQQSPPSTSLYCYRFLCLFHDERSLIARALERGKKRKSKKLKAKLAKKPKKRIKNDSNFLLFRGRSGELFLLGSSPQPAQGSVFFQAREEVVQAPARRSDSAARCRAGSRGGAIFFFFAPVLGVADLDFLGFLGFLNHWSCSSSPAALPGPSVLFCPQRLQRGVTGTHHAGVCAGCRTGERGRERGKRGGRRHLFFFYWWSRERKGAPLFFPSDDRPRN